MVADVVVDIVEVVVADVVVDKVDDVVVPVTSTGSGMIPKSVN